MMKKILLIVLGSLMLHTVQAQTFNERYRFDKPAALFFNVFEYNDTIVVQGVTAFELSYLVTGTTIAKISKEGEVLDTMIAVFDSLESNFPKDIDIRGDKIYSFGHGGYGIYYFDWGTIMQLDHNFHPLWIKKYRPNGLGSGSFLFVDGEILNDGSLLVLGRHTTTKRDTYLMKFDSLGNLQWEKKYKAPNLSYNGKSLLVLNDSTYLIGLNLYPLQGSGGTYLDVRNAIIKTDSSGNVLHFWDDVNVGEISGRGVEKMVGMDDGGVIFVGRRYYNDTIIGVPNSEIQRVSKSYICRLDSNFNKVWEREPGMHLAFIAVHDVGLYDVIPLADGNYLGVGSSGSVAKNIDGVTLYKRPGLVVKFTADGEILWERYHNYYPDYQVHVDELFFSVTELNDGSLVACGVSNLDTGYQEGWLVKMFPNGMIDSVNQVFDIGRARLSGEISVLPNPASDFVEITYDDGLMETVQIIDMNGQPVYASEPKRNQIRVNIDFLPQGMYLVLVNGALMQRFVVVGR